MNRQFKSLVIAQNNRQKIIDRVHKNLIDQIDFDFAIVETLDHWFLSADVGLGQDTLAPFDQVMKHIDKWGVITLPDFFDLALK